MVTALSDVDDLVRGFEAGADDFVTKPIIGLTLMARVGAQLRQKWRYESVREQFRVDPLTGAFNRGYFDVHAPRLAARCRAAREPIAILIVDVGHLKHINDTYLHAAGDLVLKAIVNRVTFALRPSDLVARRGGDEFVVVMPETGLAAALQIAERLRPRVSGAAIDGVDATVSVGAAASSPDEEEELEVMLERAETALYLAKRAGGNRVVGQGGEEPPPG